MTSRSSLQAAACAAMLLVAAACGGGGGGSPSSPSPSPGPSVNPCSAVGQSVAGTTAIANGSDCSPSNSPVVRLVMLAGDGVTEGTCSGTIIAARAILTAAHCLDGPVRTVRVWLGPPHDLMTATSFRFHPGYNPDRTSDIDVGVVFVGQDLGRAAVPLLVSRDARVGESAIVAGWGQNLAGDTTTLRAGATTVTAVFSNVIQTEFTTGNVGICSGDSGGPIFLSEGGAWTIGGVSSATSVNTCRPGTNFYASIRDERVRSFVGEQVPDAVRR